MFGGGEGVEHFLKLSQEHHVETLNGLQTDERKQVMSVSVSPVACEIKGHATTHFLV